MKKIQGNVMHDFARVLTLCTNADVRRRVETTLLDRYLDRIETRIGKKPFTKAQVFSIKNLFYILNFSLIVPIDWRSLNKGLPQHSLYCVHTN
jgi:hypothetical protein